jgi:hypothetical protein
MTQIQGEQGVLKAYSNARKLFQITNLPIAVMSYGLGNIGQRSIQSFMREFGSRDLKKDVNVKSIAESLFTFIKTAYDAEFSSYAEKPIVGFYIAGYSTRNVFAEEWEFVLPRDSTPKAARPETAFGASWRGIELPFTRLHKGFDPRIENQLRQLGLWTDQIEKVCKGYESPVVFDGMPVQDAVNFAVYVLQTTIGMATFEQGLATCGGQIQLATILPDDGFKWIRNPEITVQQI